MQLGLLRAVAADEFGRVFPGATVRVVQHGTNVDQPLFSSALGTAAVKLPSSTLTANQFGEISVFTVGTVSLIVSGAGIETREIGPYQVTPCAITPFEKADPTVECAAAINALLVQMADMGTARHLRGTQLTLDLAGFLWQVGSAPIVVPDTDALWIRNGVLAAIGSAWTFNDPVLRVNGSDTGAQNVTIECNNRASGIDLIGGEQTVSHCIVSGYSRVTAGLAPDGGGFGIRAAGRAGDTVIHRALVTELGANSPGWALDTSFQGKGIIVDRADVSIDGNTVVRWTGECLHLGPNCATLTVTAPTHFYNGRPPINGLDTPRIEPKLVVAERGAGAKFDGVYFDNGRNDWYSPDIQFSHCRILMNGTRAQVSYVNGVYAPQQTGRSPYQLYSTPWIYESTAPLDGSIPFWKFLPNETTGATWAGDFTKLEAAGGRQWIGKDIAMSNTSDDANLHVLDLYSPGTEATLGLYSASSTSYADGPVITGAPSTIKARRLAQRIGSLPNAAVTLGATHTGQILRCEFATPRQVTIPADLPEGWNVELVAGSSSGPPIIVRGAGVVFVGVTRAGQAMPQQPQTLAIAGAAVRITDLGYDTATPTPNRIYRIEGDVA